MWAHDPAIAYRMIVMCMDFAMIYPLCQVRVAIGFMIASNV